MQGSGLRASLFVVALAWRRARRSSSGTLLAASGIAIGTAVLVAVFSGSTIARDRSISQATERIPAASRSIRAVWFGAPIGVGQAYPRLDETVRAATASLDLPAPTPIVLFRESTVAGHFASIAGVEGLGSHVILTSGRLPRRCTPERCEVVRLRGKGTLPNAPGLRLVQVGTATLRSSRLFGDFLAPTDNALADREVAPALQRSSRYHRPDPAPLVVAEGIQTLTEAPALANTYRSYAWVWPLAAGTPRLWQIDRLVGTSERARAALSAGSIGYSIQAPVEELRAAERSATVAGRRLLLVGGEVAALLFAFAVLAARGVRRDLEAARRRLTWYGARRSQLRLLTLTESGLIAAAGTVAGWLVGILVSALVARRAGAPVGAILRESVLTPTGLALALGVVALATVVVAASTSFPSRPGGRIGPVDIAAVAALVVVLVSLGGGAADASRLATDEGAGLVLLLLPGLIAFVAAVAAARLFGPLVRLAGRLVRGSVGARLATVTLGRGPGAAAVTVAFLTLAFALALLAEGYRSTLVGAEHEEAAYAVPLDVVVREDLRSLIPVLDAAPLSRYAALGNGTTAVPVLRARASAGNAEGIGGITVLGLPSSSLPSLGGWRDDFAGHSRPELASRIAPAASAAMRGIPLERRLTFVAGPGLVSLRATIAAKDGSFSSLDLGELSRTAPTRIDRALPPKLVGGTLVAIELVPPRLVDRGADAGGPLSGRLRLVGLPAKGWLGDGGVVVRPARGGVELAYRISRQEEARMRARQPTDADPPHVLVTPRLGVLAGGEGGRLSLVIGGKRVPVVVAGVVQRFPATEGDAVIGDLAVLQTAIDTEVPGAGRVDEIWLDTQPGSTAGVMTALAQPPFRGVQTESRAALLEEASNDPLGHSTLLALTAAAVVALLLAAVGLALTVLTDLRDDRGDLYDLEAQGASPGLLRRIVRVRALVVGIAGVVAGAAAGVLLALLVTRVVTVTSRAAASTLPVSTSFDLRVVGIAALAYLLLASALVALATRRSFRSDRGPLRAQEGGT